MGSIDLRPFFARRGQIRPLRPRITLAPANPHRSPGAFPCAIRATANDGRTYVSEVLDPPGFSRSGIDPKAVTDKFHAITEDRLGPNSRARIIDAAMGLDRAHLVRDLMTALAAADRS